MLGRTSRPEPRASATSAVTSVSSFSAVTRSIWVRSRRGRQPSVLVVVLPSTRVADRAPWRAGKSGGVNGHPIQCRDGRAGRRPLLPDGRLACGRREQSPYPLWLVRHLYRLASSAMKPKQRTWLSFGLPIVWVTLSIVSMATRVGDDTGRILAIVFSGLLVGGILFRLWADRQGLAFGPKVQSRVPDSKVLLVKRSRPLDTLVEKILNAGAAVGPRELTFAVSVGPDGLRIWNDHREPQVITCVPWGRIGLLERDGPATLILEVDRGPKEVSAHFPIFAVVSSDGKSSASTTTPSSVWLNDLDNMIQTFRTP